MVEPLVVDVTARDDGATATISKVAAVSKKAALDIEAAQIKVEKATRAVGKAQTKYGRDSLQAREATLKAAQAQERLAFSSRKAQTAVTVQGRAVEKSAEKTSRFGAVSSFAGAAVATSLLEMGKASITAASDLQQSVGGAQAVFGRFADTVQAKADNAAKAVGLSQNAYLEQAAQLGALLKNQGVAMDQLAPKTDKLIKLGADLSATYGGTAADAVEALSAAFKGEFDPLEKYGISLKQSTINAEAFRVAGVKTQSQFNKLSIAQQRAAQQQATTNLLYKQGADAQGQFAKQTSTNAEQVQIARAEFTNLSAELGNTLIPVVNKTLEGILAVTGALKGHGTEVKIVAGALGGLAGGIFLVNKASKAYEAYTTATATVTKVLGRSAAASAVEVEGLAAAQASAGTAAKGMAASEAAAGAAAGGAGAGASRGLLAGGAGAALGRVGGLAGGIGGAAGLAGIAKLLPLIGVGFGGKLAPKVGDTNYLGTGKTLVRQNGELKLVAKSTDTYTHAVAGANAATATSSQSLMRNTAALQANNAGLKLNSKYLDKQDALSAYKADLDAVTDAVKSNGKTLDLNSQKGRDNSAALRQLARDGVAYAAQVKANGGSEHDYQRAMATTRSDLIKTAEKFGQTKRQAQALARAILGIPKHTNITVTTHFLNTHAGGSGALAPQLRPTNRAGGGYISGPGTGTSDSIAARLSNGEFVVNAKATSRNLPALAAINGGYAAGGLVGAQRFARGGVAGELIHGAVGDALGKTLVRSILKSKPTLEKATDKLAKVITSRLASAEDKLKDLTSARASYISGLKGSLIDSASITGVQFADNGRISTTSLLNQERSRAADAQVFQQRLGKLRKLGLNKTQLQQIAGDPTNGTAVAQALLAGGKSAIGESNRLNRIIRKAAGGAAIGVGRELYSDRLSSARKAVRGLKSARHEVQVVEYHFHHHGAVLSKASDIRREIVEAFERAPAGSPKLPASAVRKAG